MAYTSIYNGSQADKGIGASYVPTLQSVPTSSTLTYTRTDLPSGSQTVNFEIGQLCRVANVGSSTGYDFYQLQNIVVTNDGEENETTTALWFKVGSNLDYTSSVVAITAATSSACSITGAGNAGKQETIIYTNSTGSDLVVTVPTTYTTPDGQAIELTCPDGGYVEVSYINISGTIYARGL